MLSDYYILLSVFMLSEELWRSWRVLLYLDLHNSSDDTQPHSIHVTAKYLRVTEFQVQFITSQ